MRTVSKWLPISVVAAFFLALLVAFLVPFFTGVAYRSPIVIQLNNLKRLGLALRDYAAANHGKFPTHIFDVPISGVPEEIRQFHDPVNGETHDWIYFAGRKIDDPELTILAASTIESFHDRDIRVDIGNYRIVVFVDDTAEIMREAEFQQLLSAQHK